MIKREKSNLQILYNGFTFAELLVVITTMTILFGLGFANFRDYSKRTALQNVATQIKGDLRLVQERALTGNKPRDTNCLGSNILNGFEFLTVDTNTYRIRANCSGATVDEKDVNLPNGYTITTNPASALRFKVLGHGTNLTANYRIIITQTSSGDTLTIMVSPNGEIYDQ